MKHTRSAFHPRQNEMLLPRPEIERERGSPCLQRERERERERQMMLYCHTKKEQEGFCFPGKNREKERERETHSLETKWIRKTAQHCNKTNQVLHMKMLTSQGEIETNNPTSVRCKLTQNARAGRVPCKRCSDDLLHQAIREMDDLMLRVPRYSIDHDNNNKRKNLERQLSGTTCSTETAWTGNETDTIT